jgi:hypothetical protein
MGQALPVGIYTVGRQSEPKNRNNLICRTVVILCQYGIFLLLPHIILTAVLASLRPPLSITDQGNRLGSTAQPATIKSGGASCCVGRDRGDSEEKVTNTSALGDAEPAMSPAEAAERADARNQRARAALLRQGRVTNVSWGSVGEGEGGEEKGGGGGDSLSVPAPRGVCHTRL